MTERQDALEILIRMRNGFRRAIAEIDASAYKIRRNPDVISFRELSELAIQSLTTPIDYLRKPEQKPIIIKESIYTRRKP